MKKKRLILIIICAMLLSIALFFKPILVSLANYLIVEDEPYKADVIVVLAGEVTGERINYAVELYKKGYSKKLLLSGWSNSKVADTAFTMRRIALEEGIPDSAILMETRSTSTYENAVFSSRIIQENGFNSIILVTSTYHSKRSKYIFAKVLNKNIKIISCPAKVQYYNPNKWWNSRKGRKTFIDEYKKLIGYYIYY